MRFYVPLVVNSKIIFWDIIPCSSVGCFHISETPLASTFSSVFSTLRWRNDVTFLKNGKYLPKYMVIYSRRPYQSRGVILNAFIHKRYSHLFLYTVIPRLTSDPANEFFGKRIFFFAVFQTRLTNMDSANECFSGCAC